MISDTSMTYWHKISSSSSKEDAIVPNSKDATGSPVVSLWATKQTQSQEGLGVNVFLKACLVSIYSRVCVLVVSLFVPKEIDR